MRTSLRWFDYCPLLVLISLPLLLYNLIINPFGRSSFSFLPFISSFQTLTLVLTLTLFASIYFLLLHKMKFIDRIILTVATTVLATHFYEALHALFQLHVTGSTGMTLWMFNIPVVVWLGLFALFYGRKHEVLQFNWLFPFLFTSLMISFQFLGNSGFFLNRDAKGSLWAVTKVFGYGMWVPLFVGGEGN